MTDVASRQEARLEGTEPLQRRRILVVDDNTIAARLLSMLISKLGGHDVDTANDGPSALIKIRESRPHLVLLDIGLPGMDGYQVARAVRCTPELGDVRLVALTGYGREEDRLKSAEAGFERHLVKPVEMTELIAIISESEPPPH